MFNVAVIRLKDILKFFILGVLAICVVFFLYKKNLKEIDIGQKVSANLSQCVKESVELELPVTVQSTNTKQDDKNKTKTNKILNMIIGLELGIVNAREKATNNTEISSKAKQNIENQEKDTQEISKEREKSEDKNEEDEQEVELAKGNVDTQVITKNPIADAYTKKYKGVKIKNETSYDLTDEDLNPDKLKIDKSNIIIFHTHTCESYTSSKKYTYTPTGNFRTTDLKYSVSRVGDELTKYLKKYNLNVIHDKTYHDYPSYNGSYSRSLATVSNLLKSTKADIIIDLHRDAIGSYSGYAPTVKIGDDECAQIMFVIGTDGGKLKHPNWKFNLQFAIKLQEKANKEYPGLFKPIILRNSRYNQHLGKAACIIEVGSTGNKLEQCLNSMKYLSKIVNEI